MQRGLKGPRLDLRVQPFPSRNPSNSIDYPEASIPVQAVFVSAGTLERLIKARCSKNAPLDLKSEVPCFVVELKCHNKKVGRNLLH